MTGTLRTLERPQCPVCGDAGAPFHAALEDLLFGAPGQWTLRACRRADCGAAWLDPAPHPDDLALAYREYYTHSASQANPARTLRSTTQKVWAAWRLGYPMPQEPGAQLRALALVLRPRRIQQAMFHRLHAPYVADGRLLDVGCGAGNQLRLLRALGWQVSGLDPDAQAVAAARADGLDVRAGDLLSEHWPDSHFDTVTMVHVIEHLVQPERHLRECLRILKPGGHLVVVTPNLGAFGRRWFGRDWRGLEPPRHLQLYSLPALRRSLVDAGFDLQRAGSSARDAGHMLWYSEQLRRARSQEMSRIALRANDVPLRWRLAERVERALALLRVDVGEELVALARRPG